MFCRLRQCRQILPKLNLSAILLLFLIKRAALGNLKVNFHCAHWHRFFPLKEALSKPTSPPLNLKRFSKTHQSSLNLKGGVHLSSRSSSIVFTTPSVPLVGDRNLRGKEETAPLNSLYDPFGSPCRGQKRCSNRFAIWLADHQRSTPAAELRFFVRG